MACDTIILLMWAIEKNEPTLHKVGNLLFKALIYIYAILQALLHLRSVFKMYQVEKKQGQSILKVF